MRPQEVFLRAKKRGVTVLPGRLPLVLQCTGQRGCGCWWLPGKDILLVSWGLEEHVVVSQRLVRPS